MRTGAVVSVLALSVAGGVSVVSADETSSANTTAGNVEVVASDTAVNEQFVRNIRYCNGKEKHLLLQQ